MEWGSILFIVWLVYIWHQDVQEHKAKQTPKQTPKPLITDPPLPTMAAWERPKKSKDYVDYNTYILSEEWLTSDPRLNCIEAANNKCQMCGAGWGLAVHHVRYTNLGKELPQDLVLLCQLCHEHTHKMAGKGAVTYPPIRRPDYSSKSFSDLIKGI